MEGEVLSGSTVFQEFQCQSDAVGCTTSMNVRKRQSFPKGVRVVDASNS